MNVAARYLTAFAVIISYLCVGWSQAQTVTALGGQYANPQGIAVDTAGNVFVADTGGSVAEKLSLSDGYLSTTQLASSLGPFGAVATDHSGNLFIACFSGGTVLEATAAGGYATVKVVSTGLVAGIGNIAVDGSGNLFVTDLGSVYEILAAGGYKSAKPIARGFGNLSGIAVDGAGNVFVADTGNVGVYEIVAVNGSFPANPVVKSLGSSFSSPGPIALDANDNVFVADAQFSPPYQSGVKEISAASGYTTVTMATTVQGGAWSIAVDKAGNLFAGNDLSITEYFSAGGYQNSRTVLNGPSIPIGLAVDGNDDVFMASGGANAVFEFVAAGGYSSVNTVVSGFQDPYGIAVDGQGNVFVSDWYTNTVREILAVGGYLTIRTIGSGFSRPEGLAVDGAGNVFVADNGNTAVKEILAAGGYQTVRTLAGAFVGPKGVALDAAGNVFVADADSDLQPDHGHVAEILASNGYTTANTLNIGPSVPISIALDQQGNIFFVDQLAGLREISASSSYQQVSAVDTGVVKPLAVAADRSGNLFFSSGHLFSATPGDAVFELTAGAPALEASTLPSARAAQAGQTTTLFATLINAGTATLQNCRIALPAPNAYQLAMHYQTTDPQTNVVTGTPDTPVSLAGGGGTQSFVVSLRNNIIAQGVDFTLVDQVRLQFGCNSVLPAASVAGVNTLDLMISSPPPADIIALAATPSGNGVVTVPKGGAAAFAVASMNIGATDTITVSADTGTTKLPLVANICQTNPADGQCLATPTSGVRLSYAGGSAPTFSVFLQATDTIPFAPDSSRVFVRFMDFYSNEHGATSVAVQTQ